MLVQDTDLDRESGVGGGWWSSVDVEDVPMSTAASADGTQQAATAHARRRAAHHLDAVQAEVVATLHHTPTTAQWILADGARLGTELTPVAASLGQTSMACVFLFSPTLATRAPATVCNQVLRRKAV